MWYRKYTLKLAEFKNFEFETHYYEGGGLISLWLYKEKNKLRD
jgi:hypothetical protein